MLADHQSRHLQGVSADPLTVAAGATECVFSIRIPTWLEMNLLGRVVMVAVGQVKDVDSRVHHIIYGSAGSNDEIIILTGPAPITLNLSTTTLVAHPNSTLKLDVTLNRGQ
jgi:hypothetical protein